MDGSDSSISGWDVWLLSSPLVADLRSRRRRLRSESRSRQGDASARLSHSPQQPVMLARSLAAGVGPAVSPSPTWAAGLPPLTRWSCRCSVSSCDHSRTSWTPAGQTAPADDINVQQQQLINRPRTRSASASSWPRPNSLAYLWAQCLQWDNTLPTPVYSSVIERIDRNGYDISSLYHSPHHIHSLVSCITVLTGNRLRWTVRCGRPPLLPSCRKLEFRLSALMDSDLAWVNGKSSRQSWCYADAFQRSIISAAIYHFIYHMCHRWHMK